MAKIDMPQFAGDTPDVVLKDDSDKGFWIFLLILR